MYLRLAENIKSGDQYFDKNKTKIKNLVNIANLYWYRPGESDDTGSSLRNGFYISVYLSIK